MIGMYYSGQKLKEIKKTIDPEILSQINQIISKKNQKGVYLKEFLVADSKLYFKYLSNWVEIEDKKILNKVLSEEAKEKYNLKTLFFARKITESGLSQLLALEGTLPKGKDINDIVNAMKDFYAKEGWQMNIINSIKKDNQLTLFAEYTKPNSHSFKSEEKIIISNQTFYIVSFYTIDRHWYNFKEEADEIINSIKILE